jgi:hypothetical protein
MPPFTMKHLFHVRPVGSLVEETHEVGHELKQGVGPITPHRPGHRHQSLHLPVVGLPWQAYVRFVGWLPVGIVIYLLYGYSHSGLRHHYPDALDLPEIEPDADAPEMQAPGAR